MERNPLRHSHIESMARVRLAIEYGDIELYAMTREERLANENIAVAPTLRLSYAAALVLANDLWSAGIRPTEGKVSDKTLEAKNEHISDLRKVLDRALKD